MKKTIYTLSLVCMLNVSTLPDSLKSQIDEIVQSLLEWNPKSALVVGIVENGNRHVYAYGQLSHENSQKPDSDTVFEIGSISKVFTAILLSDMALKGEVQLGDPIQKYFPDSVTMSAWKARDISLHDLARHTSGLPRMPDNLSPKDSHNPYADYTGKDLYDFLNRVEYENPPGTKAVYSNLGFGLLGHLLGRKAGSNFEGTVIARICEPLQMTDTAVTLTDGMKSRMAQGYRADGELNGRWEFTDAFAGAGGLCSTAHDMVKFLSANMGLVKTGVDEAILFAQQAHLPEDRLVNPDILLGWFVAPLGDEHLRVIHHSGETGGYHTFLGFNRERQIGTVVLFNAPVVKVDHVGFNILQTLAGLETLEID